MHQRVTSARPCQVCGAASWCTFDPHAGLVYCKRVATDREAGPWGWVHVVDATPGEYDPKQIVRKAPPARNLSATQAEARHLFYQALAAQTYCALTAEDRAELHRRGFTDAQIRRRGYFSYPDKTWLRQAMRDLERVADPRRSAVARRWKQAHPDDLLQVLLWSLPGVYAVDKSNGSGFYNRLVPVGVRGVGALGIPVRDMAGHITRVRLRHRADDATRYTWLSTSDAPSGAPVHLARPATHTDRARLIIVEGELKADLSADRLGCLVLSVPGIDNQAGVVPALEQLTQRGDISADTRIAVAYDVEPSKPQVLAARDRLAQRLAEAGYAVTLLVWDAEQGKGLDDLLAAGGTFSEIDYRRKARRGLVLCDEIAPVAAATVCDTLEDADTQMRALVDRLLPINSLPGGKLAAAWHVLRATTGLGKTASILKRLHRLLQMDHGQHWPRVLDETGTPRPARILYLCDTRQLLEEKSTEYLQAHWRTALTLQLTAGDSEEELRVWQPERGTPYWILQGRNQARESPSFCANPRARTVGARRHLVPRDVCDHSAHPCAYLDECKQGWYLAAKQRAKSARLVLATKAAFLNGSEELDGFDVVIFDEKPDEWLLEHVTVTQEDLDLWRRLLAERDPDRTHEALEAFLAWLQAAAAYAAAHAPERRETAAREALRATAPADAKHITQGAIGSCNDMASKGLPRAVCELPLEGGPVPLRAIYDLATTLLHEWERETPADTRLTHQPSGALLLRKPRTHLINYLADKRVIWLDATADVAQIRRMAQTARHPVTIEAHDLAVTADVEVWQVTDNLFKPETLAKDAARTLQAIAETLQAVAAQQGISEQQVAVMTRKRFDPNEEACEHDALAAFTVGHYGKDEKATDRFRECGVLASLGNYTPNIGAIEATLAAWRDADTLPTNEAGRRILRYPGTAYGIERETHQDPDVQAAIEHVTWEHETQTLGRLRAIRRDGQRLIWVRFNSTPYDSLPVTKLLTHNELRALVGLAPLEHLSEAQRQTLLTENERRAAEADAKCAAAYAELRADGKPVTARALRNKTGVRNDVAKAFLARQEAASGHLDAPTCPPGTTDTTENISVPVRRTALASSPENPHDSPAIQHLPPSPPVLLPISPPDSSLAGHPPLEQKGA